jgi:LysR family nitrogen assimilation transcriptional regulator
VIPSKRHGLRLVLENRAAEAGIELKPRLEIDTLSAICEVVAPTQLVTVLPRIALQPMLAANKLRRAVLRGRAFRDRLPGCIARGG